MKLKNVEDIYPLTPLQQGILFHSISDQNKGVYCDQLIWELKGELDIQAFRDAWNRVMDRHPVFRTAFLWEGLNEPLQVVRQKVDLPWQFLDWTEISGKEFEDKLETYLKEEQQKGFDFKRAPLFRLTLIQRNKNIHYFIWSFHHILLDGWSMARILKELFAFYRALRKNEIIDLSPPKPFRDYIAWLQKQDLTGAESFWRNQLQDFDSPTLFNSGENQSTADSGLNYIEKHLQLSETETEQLQNFARERKITLNTLVQCAWAILLAQLTENKKIIFGATFSGRPAELAGVDEMVGLFINTLPIPVKFDPDQPISDLLKSLHHLLAEIIIYQHTPLFMIQKWSNLPKGVPMFESFVVFENYPLDSSLLNIDSDLQITNIQFRGFTNYPLQLRALPGRQLSLDLIYRGNFLETHILESLLPHFKNILLTISLQPETRLGELLQTKQLYFRSAAPKTGIKQPPLFPENEIEQSIIRRFDKQVEKFGRKLAVQTENYQWNYQQLGNASRQIAMAIMEVWKGNPGNIAVLMDHDAPMIATILGVLRTGNAYVPLDPTYPQQRLIFMFQDSESRLLLADENNLELAQKIAPSEKILSIPRSLELTASPRIDAEAVSPDALAYILYTSGSTGQPKGVMQSQRNVLAHIRNYTNKLNIASFDRLTLLASYSFDAAVMDIFGALLNGASLHPFNLKKHPIERLADWVNEQQITIYHSTPTVFRYFLNSLPENETFPSVRLVVLGGEEAFKSDFDLFKKYFSTDSFLINGYGPTECTIATQFWLNHDSEISSHTIPIGYPVEGIEIVLLDANGNRAGSFGEIGIKSQYVALGYWHREAETEAKFLREESNSKVRIYRTGDLGQLNPDGTYVFKGRLDNQVKIRGYRVELGEIEAELNRLLGIENCAVIPYQDSNGNTILGAFLEVAQPSEWDEWEVKNKLLEKLPEYMMPNHIIFTEKLPMTPTGKIDQIALKEQLQQVSRERSHHHTPQTNTEKFLASLWGEVLGLDNIQREDNFFDLGGHSILAMQVISKVEKETGYRIHPRMLALQSLQQIAALIDLQKNSHTEKQSPSKGGFVKTIKRAFLKSYKR